MRRSHALRAKAQILRELDLRLAERSRANAASGRP
ncbi:hypothetical protein J2X36_000536 [Methylobacterium sp. BE186]|nr:hypothetical protein [Methylobacterium sp. BE186]